jgi:hypothetical protein
MQTRKITCKTISLTRQLLYRIIISKGKTGKIPILQKFSFSEFKNRTFAGKKD